MKSSGASNRFIHNYHFYDEIFKTAHKIGALSMVNSGPITTGPHFVIIIGPARWLDGKDVVFGRVTSGMDLIHRIDAIKTFQNDKPKS